MNPRTTTLLSESKGLYDLRQRYMTLWYQMTTEFSMEVIAAFVQTAEQTRDAYVRESYPVATEETHAQ